MYSVIVYLKFKLQKTNYASCISTKRSLGDEDTCWPPSRGDYQEEKQVGQQIRAPSPPVMLL